MGCANSKEEELATSSHPTTRSRRATRTHRRSPSSLHGDQQHYSPLSHEGRDEDGGGEQDDYYCVEEEEEEEEETCSGSPFGSKRSKNGTISSLHGSSDFSNGNDRRRSTKGGDTSSDHWTNNSNSLPEENSLHLNPLAGRNLNDHSSSEEQQHQQQGHFSVNQTTTEIIPMTPARYVPPGTVILGSRQQQVITTTTGRRAGDNMSSSEFGGTGSSSEGGYHHTNHLVTLVQVHQGGGVTGQQAVPSSLSGAAGGLHPPTTHLHASLSGATSTDDTCYDVSATTHPSSSQPMNLSSTTPSSLGASSDHQVHLLGLPPPTVHASPRPLGYFSESVEQLLPNIHPQNSAQIPTPPYSLPLEAAPIADNQSNNSSGSRVIPNSHHRPPSSEPLLETAAAAAVADIEVETNNTAGNQNILTLINAPPDLSAPPGNHIFESKSTSNSLKENSSATVHSSSSPSVRLKNTLSNSYSVGVGGGGSPSLGRSISSPRSRSISSSPAASYLNNSSTLMRHSVTSYQSAAPHGAGGPSISAASEGSIVTGGDNNNFSSDDPPEETESRGGEGLLASIEERKLGSGGGGVGNIVFPPATYPLTIGTHPHGHGTGASAPLVGSTLFPAPQQQHYSPTQAGLGVAPQLATSRGGAPTMPTVTSSRRQSTMMREESMTTPTFSINDGQNTRSDVGTPPFLHTPPTIASTAPLTMGVATLVSGGPPPLALQTELSASASRSDDQQSTPYMSLEATPRAVGASGSQSRIPVALSLVNNSSFPQARPTTNFIQLPTGNTVAPLENSSRNGSSASVFDHHHQQQQQQQFTVVSSSIPPSREDTPQLSRPLSVASEGGVPPNPEIVKATTNIAPTNNHLQEEDGETTRVDNNTNLAGPSSTPTGPSQAEAVIEDSPMSGNMVGPNTTLFGFEHLPGALPPAGPSAPAGIHPASSQQHQPRIMSPQRAAGGTGTPNHRVSQLTSPSGSRAMQSMEGFSCSEPENPLWWQDYIDDENGEVRRASSDVELHHQ